MVIAGQTIRKLCLEQDMLSPFNERTVHRGKSYGLSIAGYDVRVAQYLQIPPGGFTLASTVERFNMPNNVIAFVHDKSTWARMGLAVQNTVIEPGWSGYLTIELTNHSKEWIEVHADEPIAQIVFHRLDEPAEKPYSGKYQNQEAGPQAARLESVEHKVFPTCNRGCPLWEIPCQINCEHVRFE